mgnify:CR=1 FL=1
MNEWINGGIEIKWSEKGSIPVSVYIGFIFQNIHTSHACELFKSNLKQRTLPL